ncbi:hypothetical protein AB0F17_34145 [Nonomuraea sp. NPDC026600]|uniref:hypothetical protein n=1 Tax=Nonomuraea sp. NPDC026600 TaxID=3155363 RepID=UPI0033D3BF89
MTTNVHEMTRQDMAAVNELVRDLAVEALNDHHGTSQAGLHLHTARPHDNPEILTAVIVHPDGRKSTAMFTVEFVDWDAAL